MENCLKYPQSIAVGKQLVRRIKRPADRPGVAPQSQHRQTLSRGNSHPQRSSREASHVHTARFARAAATISSAAETWATDPKRTGY
jgi:hypothetical protein